MKTLRSTNMNSSKKIKKRLKNKFVFLKDNNGIKEYPKITL
ncbi:hypothetical protein HPHPA11_1288 [Helicobacter pylori Hp A-11]|uniref:Uncharacterized protein n=1 Tax=Helicobacter pylori Hp A-11 TaxID=992035 RepID=N4TLT4_HELPX|nr:hypothetical protein HPHPA11_1288 [Helicobacter pylori Hp A-11]